MRNTVIISDAVREGQTGFSKKDIQKRTGVSWGTMCKIVDSLVAQGYLFARKQEPSGRGRPMIPICINPASAYFIGIDLGASRTRMLVCDLNFNTIYKNEIPTPYYSGEERFFDWLRWVFDTIVNEAPMDRGRLKGVGMSVSGNVDHETGVIVSGGNWGVKWGTNLPAGGVLAKYARVPVSVVTAASAGVLAEYHFGRWRGHSNLVTVGLGVGIASGVISNGHLLVSQPRCPVGYIGHMLIPGNQHICTCGFRGCLESYSGGEYLAAVAREKIPDRPELHSAAALDYAAENGYPEAIDILTTAASYNAVGIASMIQLYSPDALIFYGGQCRKDGFLFKQTLKALENVLPQERMSRFEIGLSTLGSLQSALGGVRMAYEKFF